MISFLEPVHWFKTELERTNAKSPPCKPKRCGSLVIAGTIPHGVYPHRLVLWHDKNKYTGILQRQLRALRGVGRPPKVRTQRERDRVRKAWEQGLPLAA
jgi:hypothetical protein